MDKYFLERDGQLDFYHMFLPRVNPELKTEEIIADNNDGVVNGNLLEFKLHITDLNAVLFQCIKYLSAMRVKGKPVPANILAVDLNAAVAWVFKSASYLPAIETLYSGCASKDNSGFLGGSAEKVLHYGESPLDAERLAAILKENFFTKINIDENCVVGWAVSFYKALPNARKEDFLGDDTGKHKTIEEIRKPESPQKAAMREIMRSYLKENDIRIKNGADVNAVMRDMVFVILDNILDEELDEELGYSKVRLPEQGY